MDNPIIAEDIINDHTGIEDMMKLTYCLKTFKLVIIIFNISYFLGMLWYIFADIVERSVLAYREIYPNSGGGPSGTTFNEGFFMKNHDLDTEDRT